ncbi:MAG: hypothetical protein J6R22_03380 [Alphaproteobacteria bacterium]|nr:hypothetical protein [Alphaproteobacteria bacterium]
MAFDAYFFNFQKKENSTLTPTQAQWEAGADLMINLLDETSILNPTFRLELSTPPMASATKYNYCYVPDFHRFYFIDDWSTYRNLWICKCHCDVLASFKSEIIASRQYVIRSASAFDTYISDALYPATTHEIQGLDIKPLLSQGGSTDFVFADHMSYLVGVVSYTVYNVGSNVYYWMTESELQFLMSLLMSDNNWMFGSDTSLTGPMQKALTNPIQYIVSCIALPFERPTPTQDGSNGVQAVTSIAYGWYTLTNFNTAVLRDNFTYTKLFNFYDIPKHPQNSRGLYMNAEPFTHYDLEFEPFGIISLPAITMLELSRLRCLLTVDLVTGAAILKVDNPLDVNHNILCYRTGQVGIPIQLSQMSVSNFGKFSSAWSAAASLFRGDLGGAVSGIADVAKGYTPSLETTGSNGSLMSISTYYRTPILHSRFLEVVDDDNADNGRPLMADRLLSSLSGYTLIDNPHLALSCTAGETEQIVTFMKSGFFIE